MTCAQLPSTLWVHDEEMEVLVTYDEATRYLWYGWQVGRLRDCCCHCGKRFNKTHCKNHESRCNAKKLRKIKKLKHLSKGNN
jgi:hypothetical protein